MPCRGVAFATAHCTACQCGARRVEGDERRRGRGPPFLFLSPCGMAEKTTATTSKGLCQVMGMERGAGSLSYPIDVQMTTSRALHGMHASISLPAALARSPTVRSARGYVVSLLPY